MMNFAEALGCRRLPLLEYFGETLSQPCVQCDQCVARVAKIERMDATLSARKFFSCVVETGEVFGAAHIISILRGSRSRKVSSKGHDRLASYGSGKEHLEEEWRRLAREFVKLGLLETDREFGGLRLTSSGRSVLRSGEKVFVPKTAHHGAPAIKVSQDCSELFQRLRELRKGLAEEAGMPAYVVFSDRALQEMAAVRPRDERQFLAINGVGQAKLARYGNTFLRVIREYCQ
jgi:ATP-dependent DNA helicase RecQ